jgi:hypothetical protein
LWVSHVFSMPLYISYKNSIVKHLLFDKMHSMMYYPRT